MLIIHKVDINIIEGLMERSLRTADIGASAVVDVDVEIVATPTGVLADEALLIGFLDRPLQSQALIDILTPAQEYQQ